MSIIDTLLGTSSARRIKKLEPNVRAINALEPMMKQLSDGELRAKTDEFKSRLASKETLDSLLPEAFAVVREAAIRTIGQRHYDVQLIGGMVLHNGQIAEMKTGEGKTLVATLPSYLNALEGKGVHIVTVNDYLARRDAQWMGKIHRFLGLSVGCIVREVENDDRRIQYACDITYGTNNEFGFDYLRDNMVVRKERMVQRDLHYAIVDEVDSILIDEARTPLIISGHGPESSELYRSVDRFASRLERGETVRKITQADILRGEKEQPESGDYMVDIKARTAALTQRGIEKAMQYFGIEDITDPANSELNHHILQALKAYSLFSRDKDYVVQDGQVIIVDEFTGRLMIGRRWSDGLHQAVEAKEGVKIESENKTLATITFQNYFRMYHKLGGMTGTAKTEESEFQGIYNLEIIEIPTNKPMIRRDANDIICITEESKYRQVVDEIIRVHATGQPILVGTVSVEKSEMLSRMLKLKGIKHNVLNAKHHMREAEIVAQAGRFGAVTIATNMAGRGTDISLGGNPEFMAKQELRNKAIDDALIEAVTNRVLMEDPEFLAGNPEIPQIKAYYDEAFAKYKALTDEEHERVVAVGGLYILGTERHESRRIDNQLRGRAGRQGDPGVSRFYVSLEDELMQRFKIMDRTVGLMQSMTGGEDIALNTKILSRQVEQTQKRVEAHNFEIRKSVLQYDDVMNKQREIIYSQRRTILMGEDITGSIQNMIQEAIDTRMDMYCNPNVKSAEYDLIGLAGSLFELSGIKLDPEQLAGKSRDDIRNALTSAMKQVYSIMEQRFGDAGIDMREVERTQLLKSIDIHWMDHIDTMHDLKQGIGLRAMAHHDPVMEYRNEGSEMFDAMISDIRETTVRFLYHTVIRASSSQREQVGKPIDPSKVGPKTPVRSASKGKPGPNSPCPCGSGKKYKVCCGKRKAE